MFPSTSQICVVALWVGVFVTRAYALHQPQAKQYPPEEVTGWTCSDNELVVAHANGVVGVWTLLDGAPVRNMSVVCGGSIPTHVFVLKDGLALVTQGAAGADLRLVSGPDRTVKCLPLRSPNVMRCGFVADVSIFMYDSALSGSCFAIRVADGKPLWTFDPKPEPLPLRPDIVLCKDGTGYIVVDGDRVSRRAGKGDLAWSWSLPAGKWRVVGDGIVNRVVLLRSEVGDRALVLAAGDGKVIRERATAGGAIVAGSEDGSRLAVRKDGKLLVVEGESGKQVDTQCTINASSEVRFTRDGRYLVIMPGFPEMDGPVVLMHREGATATVVDGKSGATVCTIDCSIRTDQ